MGDASLPTGWLLVSVPTSATDARRELLRAGAVPVGEDVWTVPDSPSFAAGIEGASAVTPADPSERMTLMTAFNAARSAEWTQFRAECQAFDGTEQGLDALRQRAHDIQARDIFSVPEAEVADRDLRACAALLPHLDSNQKPFD